MENIYVSAMQLEALAKGYSELATLPEVSDGDLYVAQTAPGIEGLDKHRWLVLCSLTDDCGMCLTAWIRMDMLELWVLRNNVMLVRFVSGREDDNGTQVIRIDNFLVNFIRER